MPIPPGIPSSKLPARAVVVVVVLAVLVAPVVLAALLLALLRLVPLRLPERKAPDFANSLRFDTRCAPCTTGVLFYLHERNCRAGFTAKR